MRALKRLRQWMRLSKGKILVGHAIVEKNDVLPNWLTEFHSADKKTMSPSEYEQYNENRIVKMVPAHVLSIDPSRVPVGTLILIYYPED